MHVTLKNGHTIRPCHNTSDDGEALGEMLDSCSERTYYFFHPYPLTYESGLRVAANENIICFVAFADGDEAVGYIWMDRDGDVPGLGICVQDGWQGLGIGRTLMARIIAEAKELGKSGLQLTVMQDNMTFRFAEGEKRDV